MRGLSWKGAPEQACMRMHLINVCVARYRFLCVRVRICLIRLYFEMEKLDLLGNFPKV